MQVKQCSRCEIIQPLTNFRKRYDPTRTKQERAECKKCENQWRNRVQHKRTPEKFGVYNRAHYAKKIGRIKESSLCDMCGERNPLQGHHPDYSKPLEVEWLCQKCHTKVHRKKQIA